MDLTQEQITRIQAATQTASNASIFMVSMIADEDIEEHIDEIASALEEDNLEKLWNYDTRDLVPNIETAPLLKLLEPAERVAVLSIQNEEGDTPLRCMSDKARKAVMGMFSGEDRKIITNILEATPAPTPLPVKVSVNRANLFLRIPAQQKTKE